MTWKMTAIQIKIIFKEWKNGEKNEIKDYGSNFLKLNSLKPTYPPP